jgi:hypothetical protein
MKRVATELRAQGILVETGVFAAHMQVELLNGGPVTFVLDKSRRELIPICAQVCLAKTERRIIGPTSALRPTSAILKSYVFGMSERWIWERKFRHGIRSVSCSAP